MEKTSITKRIRHAWSVFTSSENHFQNQSNNGYGTYTRPDRVRLRIGNERSIITAIYNKIAIDVSSINIRHVRVDDDDQYLEIINSAMNECFSLDANLDQTGRAFFLDACLSLFDEGSIALVPVITDVKPNENGNFDIYSIRVAKILEWYPNQVRVNLYNEMTGLYEEKWFLKRNIAIIENPLYTIMNERSSTLQRLIRKLSILDVIDEQSGSGKLDIIVQLPYVIKTPTKERQAEERRKSIEMQLSDSKYGIAYIDGTEKVTQLNRPAENNLMSQITYLTNMVFNELGMTEAIFDGTADEATMLNYHNRTIEPIVSAFVDEMRRKFLSKTARTRRQSIQYFRDPFKLVPVSELANIADKFTRNEILSSNEVRGIIGRKPSSNPRADELSNKNISQKNEEQIQIDPKGESHNEI